MSNWIVFLEKTLTLQTSHPHKQYWLLEVHIFSLKLLNSIEFFETVLGLEL